MASSFTNNAEGADGTPVTTASTTGGTQWNTVIKGTTGIVEYDSAHKMVGDTAIKFGSTADADRGHVWWSGFSPTTTQKISVRFYGYFTSFTTYSTICAVQETDSTRVASFSVNNTGKITLTDSPGETVESAGVLQFGVWYRFELIVDLTAPLITLKTFVGHSTTPDPTLSATKIPDTATDLIQRVMFGKYSTGLSCTFWLDEMAVNTESVVPIGPIAGSGAAHYTMSGNFTPDTSTLVSWTVDATASTGTTTLVQTSGPTVSIVQSPTNVYTVSNPAAAGDIGLKLTATSGGSTSQNLLIARGSGTGGGTIITDKPYRWTFQGGGPASAIGNWK